MKYHVLFCNDNKICFQGEGNVGIVNPEDILANGRLTKNVKHTDLKDKSGQPLSIDEVDVIFEPD